jgi:hypothetical protein
MMKLPFVISPSLQSNETDFDFLVGQWKVANRKLKQRLSQCDDWDEFDSTLRLEKVLQGLGNIERYFASFDGRPFEGMALRLFNPATRLWSIYWMDSSSPKMDEHPVVGSFDGALGKFYATGTVGAQEVLVLYQWDKSNPLAPVWSQAFSTDQGQSWEWNWVMHFQKA